MPVSVRRLNAAPQVAAERSGNVSDNEDGTLSERTGLIHSSLGLVEHVRHGTMRVPLPRPGPEHVSPVFRVCFPYQGLLLVHTGGDVVTGDASQVLFASIGLVYRLSEPVPGGYAELCITPNLSLLADLVQAAPERVGQHLLFRRRCRRAEPRLQLLRARFLHRARSGGSDPLVTDELIVALLRSALIADSPVCEAGRPTRRLIGRTKEFVEAHFRDPISLRDVARAVGSSPAYLTDVFRRFEGLPLHKYVREARLARALVELPHANDLTTLALNLGFSSHSHFAAAFRGAFACTPSEFRDSPESRHCVMPQPAR
jgi:AraC family transcriptional regulator